MGSHYIYGCMAYKIMVDPAHFFACVGCDLPGQEGFYGKTRHGLGVLNFALAPQFQC